MHITVNGETRTVDPGTTVAGLVAQFDRGPKGVAVAVNREVVPRSAWARAALRPGDEVELLSASQGG